LALAASSSPEKRAIIFSASLDLEIPLCFRGRGRGAERCGGGNSNFAPFVLAGFAGPDNYERMSKTPVVLVTGASRGLGRGIAQSCARAGCCVAVHYTSNETAARETVTLCQSLATDASQRFVPVRGNLAVAADRSSFFEQSLATFGRLDALVNNAGMAPRERADLTDTTEASYDEVMSVNLKGPHFLSQLAARHWLQQPQQSRLPGGFKLIFVTSISADTASINRGEYCLSKAGLAMAAQLWAARLANDGVQVFEIRPGIMETDMTAGVKAKYDKLIAEGLVPQMRWGRPEDVGLAVEAILKGHFSFSTGNVIPVDGGFHLRRL
jgi:NAD(P)-dependent dehydrogenase (short-subunit alcohol dehydrogenase family)